MRGLLRSMGYSRATRSKLEELTGRIAYKMPTQREGIEEYLVNVRGDHLGALLDVGCGSGFYMNRMRRLGWQVTGLEVDKSAAQIATERYGIRVINDSIEGAKLPPNQFDAITLNHVIEHVSDPIEVLSKCREWLRGGGFIVVRTPNLNSLGHQTFGRHWMALDPPRHLHLLTLETIRACAIRAGLDIEVLDTSTVQAPGIYDVSRVIQSSGTCNLMSFPSKRSLSSRKFRLRELRARARHGDGGEELVLVATK